MDRDAILNTKFCTVDRYDKEIVYSPNEIKGYGIYGYSKYESKPIIVNDTAQLVFLEVLVEGELSLYYCKDEKGDRFFITENGSNLTEIIKKENNRKVDFEYLLNEVMESCYNVKQNQHLVLFKKKSLTTYVNHYNVCEIRPFPHLRFGATSGYGFYKVYIKTYEEYLYLIERNMIHMDFEYTGGFNFGVFIDQPILASDFSLHIEGLYSKQGYAANKTFGDNEVDFVANYSSIMVPVLFRYSFPKMKFRPFFNVGAIFGFNYNIEERLSMVSKISDGYPGIVYKTIVSGTPYIAKRQLGFSFGGGLEYRVSSKFSVFGELRYNQLYNSEYDALNLGFIHANFGIII